MIGRTHDDRCGSPDERLAGFNADDVRSRFDARVRGTCAAGVVITMQRGCALLPRLPSAVASARVCARARATDLAFARSNPAPPFARRVSAAASGDPESGHREHFANHDDLVAALHGLTGDPLEADGGRVVVYRGDPRAKIMIIGEAPGAEEDKLGVPFVGRAGKLLDQIFAAVTLDTNRHAYVTNVVKRRPANNRDPTAPEIEYYRHYLEEEIRLVDPAIIVLTGRHSMRTVLGKTEGITKIRGRWRDVEGRRVMPMFHPSYLLRNPYNTPKSPKALTWDDVREVKRVVDELGIIESEVAPPAERAEGSGEV